MWPAVRSWLFPVWCSGCGAPGVALCDACTAGLRITALMASPRLYVEAAAPYDGLIRDAVLAVKRGERAPLASLAALIAPLLPDGATLVPAVTLRRRAAERGFDQARELARRAAERCGGRLADVLHKHGPPQRGGSRAERLAAAGRFAVRRDVELPPEAILVDDVMTTGATLRDAAETLERAGVVVRRAVVAAYAPPHETSRPGRESDEA